MKKGSETKDDVIFSTWTHLGHQGLPMELWGDFQEHVYLIFTRSRNSFGKIATKTKQLENNRSKKMSGKQGARARNGTIPGAVAGLGEALYMVGGPKVSCPPHRCYGSQGLVPPPLTDAMGRKDSWPPPDVMGSKYKRLFG